jgi:hypothetical protein
MIEPMVRLLSKWSLDKIDELGKEGWEAVGIFYDAKISQTYVLLKRPMG